MAVLAIYFAEVARLTLELGKTITVETVRIPIWLYAIIVCVWIIILNATGAYTPQRTYRLALEILNLMRAIVASAFVIPGVMYFVWRDYSRLQIIYLLILLAIFAIGMRTVLRAYYKFRGGRKYDSRRILVIGTGTLAEGVGRQIRSFGWTGLYLFGYIATTASETTENNPSLNIIGTLDELPQLIDDQKIDEVIVAIQRSSYSMLSPLLDTMYERNVNVRLAPDMRDLAYVTMSVEDVNGLPLITLRDSVLSFRERIVKRIFDLSLTSILLILTLPLMVIIAIAIVIDSPGSPFFVQERVGQYRKPFRMYKFRTMIKDADKHQHKILRYDEDGNIIHKHKDDPRITRVGRWLRRTSLDELPQLVNVWLGNMSLVGPRPEMPWMVGNYEPWQLKRFEVPQGLTGWWQINGRAETMMHLATEDDLYYISHYSILLDLIILFRTPSAVLQQRGAF